MRICTKALGVAKGFLSDFWRIFTQKKKALGVAKGFLAAPLYLDVTLLSDGSHSIGLLHIGNLGEGQDAEKV
jgi:hypothetical protein